MGKASFFDVVFAVALVLKIAGVGQLTWFQVFLPVLIEFGLLFIVELVKEAAKRSK
jgi:hypothetical protein